MGCTTLKVYTDCRSEEYLAGVARRQHPNLSGIDIRKAGSEAEVGSRE